MPLLDGNSTTRSAFGWRGTLVTRYDLMTRSLPMASFRQAYTRLLSERLRQIAWQIASTLVRRGLYLHAVTNCQLLPMDTSYAVDLCVTAIVQPYKENLTIDEMGYWESRFAERLMFDFGAYINSQLPIRNDSPKVTWADALNPKSGWAIPKPVAATPEEYKAELANTRKSIAQMQGLQRLLDATDGVGAKTKRKWEIINKGKITANGQSTPYCGNCTLVCGTILSHNGGTVDTLELNDATTRTPEDKLLDVRWALPPGSGTNHGYFKDGE